MPEPPTFFIVFCLNKFKPNSLMKNFVNLMNKIVHTEYESVINKSRCNQLL